MSSEFDGPTPEDRFVQQTLADYSEGDHEFERDLIESYKTSIAEHLPKLEEALQSEDESSILHSHDIKGSSSYIGAEAVRFVSGKMEAYCKQKNMKEASKYLAELQKEVDEVFKLLDSYMESWDEGAQADKDDKTNKEETDNKEDNKDKAEEAKETDS